MKDKNKKKMVAPIVVTVIMLLYYTVYFGVLITVLPTVLKYVFGIVPVALSIVMVAVCIERIKEIRDMLFSMSLEQRQELDGLQKERALVIPSGVALIYRILTKAGAQKITISERDNLEGYLMIKRSQNE